MRACQVFSHDLMTKDALEDKLIEQAIESPLKGLSEAAQCQERSFLKQLCVNKVDPGQGLSSLQRCYGRLLVSQKTT